MQSEQFPPKRDGNCVIYQSALLPSLANWKIQQLQQLDLFSPPNDEDEDPREHAERVLHDLCHGEDLETRQPIQPLLLSKILAGLKSEGLISKIEFNIARKKAADAAMARCQMSATSKTAEHRTVSALLLVGGSI
jgi:hypothetical protein